MPQVTKRHAIEQIHGQTAHKTPHNEMGYHSTQPSTSEVRTDVIKTILHTVTLMSVNFNDASLEQDTKMKRFQQEVRKLQ